MILRAILLFAGLFLGGLVIAWAVTRDKRYLLMAKRGARVILLVAVVAGLLYVFERVLLL